MTEQPPIPPPKTETTTPPPKTEPTPTTPPEKAPIEPSEADAVLTELRDEYKAHVSPDQWDAVKNLSIAKQVKILRVMQPKTDPTKPKPDINIPLNNPPPVEKRVKSFLEQQQEAGFARNLNELGSFAHVANKLYQKKNQ